MAKEIKLSEVKKVTTVNENDYVVMNAAKDGQVQIKKADLAKELASGVAENIGTVTDEKNGLMSMSHYIALPYVGTLASKGLILLFSGGLWERQMSIINISNSDCSLNAHLLLTATLKENSVLVTGKTLIGSFPSTAKILYKTENNKLNIYLYGNISLGSTMGIILQSNTMRPKFLGTVEDISDYGVINI